MKKTIGNSFLIVGNTIGSGILALPLVTAVFGFLPSVLLLIFSWLVMTYSAKLLLETSYWLKDEQHLVSLLSMTLSPFAKAIVSFLYLCMMYSLLVAYISIGSDITQAVFKQTFSYDVPYAAIALVFVLIFGLVVFYSMDILERYTRFLVIILLLIFLFMVLNAVPHITLAHLQFQQYSGIVWTLPLMILCFGYPTIVPSLRHYCGDNKTMAVRIIMFGSFLALVMYILWLIAVLGVLPLEGEYGIRNLPDQKVSSLTAALHALTQSHHFNWGLTAFAYLAVATSFMSLAKILFDFLNDAAKRMEIKPYRLFAQIGTLLPPLLISIYIPGLFVYALMFGGAILGILLVFLPAFLVWRGRYHQHYTHYYQCEGGKGLLIFMMIIGVITGFIEIVQKVFYS